MKQWLRDVINSCDVTDGKLTRICLNWNPAYAFIVDQFLVVIPENVLRWLKTLKKIILKHFKGRPTY